MKENINFISTIIAIIGGSTGIIIAIYQQYKNQKYKRILTDDEMNFLMSRGEENDPLKQNLPLLKEKLLIEKAYGFSASRKEYNKLVEALDGSILSISQVPKIKSFLTFKSGEPNIKLGFAAWGIFALMILLIILCFVFASVLQIFFKDEPFNDFRVLTFIFFTFLPAYFFVFPMLLAKRFQIVLRSKMSETNKSINLS